MEKHLLTISELTDYVKNLVTQKALYKMVSTHLGFQIHKKFVTQNALHIIPHWNDFYLFLSKSQIQIICKINQFLVI